MLFAEFDHGAWLSKFGLERRSVRWIFGNPLIAITMIQYDVTAGLFAPVELITEDADHAGTTVVAHRVSSSPERGRCVRTKLSGYERVR